MTVDFRILDFNYPFQDNVDITATTEDPEFPASNFRSYIRSKAWRSSGGNFVIDSSNNKIDFKESGGGGELTATLTSGTYTASTLAAEIDTQMEAAGAGAYTISYSNGQFTISRPSGYLDLLFSSGTNVANSVHSSIGFATSDLSGSDSYTAASIALHTEEGVVIDFKTAEEVDFFSLVFDPLIGIKLSSEAVVTLQANPTDVWTSPAYSQVLSFDDDTSQTTLFLTTPQEYRYWRVKIVDTKNPYLYVELHKVLIGKGTTISRAPDIGYSLQHIDATASIINEYGHAYADIYPVRKNLSFEMGTLTDSQVQTLLNSYRRTGKAIPVAVIIDAQEALYNKDDYFIYGKYTSNFDQSNVIRDIFGISLSIEETF
jgi:hypothetical protein